ncbi:hypothetical protein [uncultured Ruthenibacterium sp.]|uniref:InlB B-repeat-containing protein n=1 Tax=uncultured Ruthenibacterium sp. TaxID=1905347 RepID=UPI00349E5409
MTESWIKRIVAMMVGTALVLCLGATAWADQTDTVRESGLTITGNSDGVQKDESGQIWISEDGSYQISGTWKGTLENADEQAPKAVLCIAGGVEADISFKNVNVSSVEEFTAALDLDEGATVRLSVSGENTLQGGENYTSIDIAKNAKLNVAGSGAFQTGAIDGSGTFALDSSFQGVVRSGEISCGTDSSKWNGILFQNEAGCVYGTPLLEQNLNISKTESLTIPKDVVLTIGKGVAVQNSGSVQNEGSIYNYGDWKGNSPKGNQLLQDAQISLSLSSQEVTFADKLTVLATARVPDGTSGGTVTFWMGEIGGNGIKLGTSQATVKGQQASAQLIVERCSANLGFAVGKTAIYADFGEMTGSLMPGQSNGIELMVKEIIRSIPAPAAQAGTELNIILGAVTPSAGGGTVEYGLATENNTEKVEKWQTGTTFTGLNAGTGYYCFARVTGDPEYAQAYAVSGPVVVPKAVRTLPAPTAVAKDVCRIEVSAVTPSAGAGTVEYGISLENQVSKVSAWQTSTVFENLTAEKTYYVFARVTGDSQYEDAVSQATAVTVPKAARTMNAPGGKAGGTDKIVLETATPSAGGGTVEYGVSEQNDSNTVTNWQAATTFTGLKAGTPYYCFARVKADPSYQDAVSKSTVIFTQKASESSATTNPETYSIQVIAGEGGTVSPSSMQVNAGSTHTFTFTPKKGYEVANVRVDVTDFGSRTSYTFEKVSGPHSLTVTFRPVKASSSSSSSSTSSSSFQQH